LPKDLPLRYRAVIFDLDGTLLDTIDDLSAAMNAALVANGLPPRPDVAEHKRMVGDGVGAYVLRAMPADKRGDAELAGRVTADYRAAYAVGWRNKTRPYDGIAGLLEALRAAGVRLAVLSNKPDDTTRATVAALLSAGAFEVICGARDGVPLKPDPAAALTIAERMGVAAGDIAYVGDTGTDMQTARAAGMFAIGALWGFRGADELLEGGADVLAERPADVLSHL
jgi:phosphoglycolate phosphatase